MYWLFSTYYLMNELPMRLIGGVLMSLGLTLLTGPWVIKILHVIQPSKTIREYVPERHLSKNGTPSLGGLLIISIILIVNLLWNHSINRITLLLLFTLLSFGAIGLLDDYLKIFKKEKRGLLAKHKYGLQSCVGLILGISLYLLNYHPTSLRLSNLIIPLGLFSIVWIYWVIVSSSNAINLTDGLDGLATSQVIIITIGLFMLAMMNTHLKEIDLESILIFCTTLIGSSLGFLWFNRYPARVFMGDVGALALGGVLGLIAILLHQEIAFAIMSSIPVLETLSVILQVFHYKRTGKRLFRMAPFHHHLELQGWKESHIVLLFTIITSILTSLSLLIFM